MLRVVVLLLSAFLISAVHARAQDPPPPIPLFVIDVQGNIPNFPQDQLLADSRGLQLEDLPGRGLGGQVGIQLHIFRFKAITFGVGGQAMMSRGTQTPPDLDTTDATVEPSVTEKFRSLGGQLSLNFGNGNGWSYLSGGIGRSNWSIIQEGNKPLEGDEEALKTINYGGGARWFMKSHLAFSFDVRFYAINPGVSSLPGKDGSPRTTFFSIGAGVSLK
jgi:outer membrane protein with beta-barrel domain